MCQYEWPHCVKRCSPHWVIKGLALCPTHTHTHQQMLLLQQASCLHGLLLFNELDNIFLENQWLHLFSDYWCCAPHLCCHVLTRRWRGAPWVRPPQQRLSVPAEKKCGQTVLLHKAWTQRNVLKLKYFQDWFPNLISRNGRRSHFQINKSKTEPSLCFCSLKKTFCEQTAVWRKKLH